MRAHLQTEAYLHSLLSTNPGFSYSVVRQGIYSESFPIYLAALDLAHLPSTGEVLIPHDGEGNGVAWAKRDELGEATAKILRLAHSADFDSSEYKGTYLNKVVLLSGPRSYTLGETVEILGRSAGREDLDLRIREVGVEEYAEQKSVRESLGYGGGAGGKAGEGVEEPGPVEWATAFEGIRRGEAGGVTGLLGGLLGREPEGFEVTIKGLVEEGGSGH